MVEGMPPPLLPPPEGFEDGHIESRSTGNE